jgi:hypothetical protein
MSFYILLSSTQLSNHDFNVNLTTPLVLHGDYEVGICEFFIKYIRKKFGNLTLWDDQSNQFLTIKYSYTINLKDINSLIEIYQNEIKSKVKFTFQNNKIILKSNQPFRFDNFGSYLINNENVLELNKKYVPEKIPEKIFITCNLVNQSTVYEKNMPLIKTFMYDGSFNQSFNTEYFDIKEKFIKKINLTLYDSNFNKVFLPKPHQHILLHFRQKNKIENYFNMKFLNCVSIPQGTVIFPPRHFTNNIEVALSDITYKINETDIFIGKLSFYCPLSGDLINFNIPYSHDKTVIQILSQYTDDMIYDHICYREYLRQVMKYHNHKRDEDPNILSDLQVENRRNTDAYFKDKITDEHYNNLKSAVYSEGILDRDHHIFKEVKKFAVEHFKVPHITKDRHLWLDIPKDCSVTFCFNNEFNIQQGPRLHAFQYKIIDLSNLNRLINYVLYTVNINYNDSSNLYVLRYFPKSDNEEHTISFNQLQYITANIKFLNKISIIITDPSGKALQVEGNAVLHFSS